MCPGFERRAVSRSDSPQDDSADGRHRRPRFEEADPSRLLNEFLLAVFLPLCVCFLLSYLAVRVVFLDALVALDPAFAEPIRTDRLAGSAVLTSGHARFWGSLTLATAATIGYLVAYARWLRGRFRRRGWV